MCRVVACRGKGTADFCCNTSRSLSLFFSDAHDRQVAGRLFPFSRGLFEDKVANLWFCADVVFKLRRRLAVPQLAKLALVSTLRWGSGRALVCEELKSLLYVACGFVLLG